MIPSLHYNTNPFYYLPVIAREPKQAALRLCDDRSIATGSLPSFPLLPLGAFSFHREIPLNLQGYHKRRAGKRRHGERELLLECLQCGFQHYKCGMYPHPLILQSLFVIIIMVWQRVVAQFFLLNSGF